MKKLITILAIMMVLIGVAFATDNAAVKLTVVVPESAPTFKLATKDSTNITTQVSDLVESSGSTGGENNGAASATATADAGKTLAAGNDLTVTFAVIQNAPAADPGYFKTTHSYKFTAEATDLVKDDNNKYAFKEVSNFADSENLTSTYGSVDVNTAKTLKVTYNGTKYAPADAVEIATFTATWTGNTTAVNGTYTATVTLTMVTT